MPYTLAPHTADLTLETEVKHSRFIAALRRVEDADAAQAFVQDRRRAYPDARHHCSAYIIGNGPSDRVERASDDGEPGGTAGIPMLQVLKARDLVDVAVVVTRYFGGIKLGAGGLVRAYSGAVTTAVDAAPLVRRELRHLHTLAVGHAEAGRVESELRGRGVV
ncbi:MAG: YigZ family protein, partial [Rhodococcus sp. (in: high G+C Gram-positive bacteria)]